jgi:hypothetical protein
MFAPLSNFILRSNSTAKLFILPVKHSIEILIAFAWFAFQVSWIEIDKVLEF